ncbi:hypothetical protein CJF32_00003038 [Rutstroemia sp. NJR-2017a WRK4]|nr:hypothetical protein CJF32_00003038 [Rutstroemia sp. NJR-2017a WRK4]
MDKLHPIITLIPQKLESVNVIVAKGKSMSYFDTIRLAKRSSSLCSTINLAIAAYEGFTPNEVEGQILLEEMMKMIELTERQLALMVETKPVFEKLWVVGYVKKDIAKLKDASAQLAKTMVAVSPEHLKAQGEEWEDRRRKAFDEAMTAYGVGA